ncbi:hypothetical protein PRJ_4438 [Pseudomonas sp. XWY-1]|nr:hypothetical protein PRJ_4438 [Pseudomonas sp. XWY-1]
MAQLAKAIAEGVPNGCGLIHLRASNSPSRHSSGCCAALCRSGLDREGLQSSPKPRRYERFFAYQVLVISGFPLMPTQ